MKMKMTGTFLTAAALVAAALFSTACGGAPDGGATTAARQPQNAQQPAARQPQQQATAQGPTVAAGAHDGHGHAVSDKTATARVPAYAKTAGELRDLPPTLAPQKFSGKTRLAYQAVAQIPKTIAQLPCYCNCDEGFGHKSLQTCFADDHASHCAVCVDEALLAYKLQTEDGLTPEQIRGRIVAQFSSSH